MSAQPATTEPIVVIDDDETMRRACHAALRRVGYQVETYSNGPSGLERIKELKPGLLIVDLKMPGMSGMEVIEHVKRIDPDLVIVVITGFATVGTAVEAMKAGAYDFVPKPFTAEELRIIIARGCERRRLAMEAKQLRREKEAQAHRFITFVSHQLQSPLGAVQQYLDVLLHQMGGDAPEQHRTWIGRCSEKLNQMHSIIDDWLKLAKVEGGQLATERVPVSWQQLAEETLPGFAAEAEQGGVTLCNQVPADLPAALGDESALRMLLANLVGNAVKYSPRGQVTVSASAEDDTVTLAVSDTGIGIAPENQEHIFEEFYRVKDKSTRGIAGTGLGLPICRKIAEELDGQVTVASQPGQGSTFSVTLPRAETGRAKPDAIEDLPLGSA
ncbi:MAG: hybrid sensor histidine kinase/response regulator [Planctomycetes bacterium]|nr:hybrid sensor histidine kinase/response regulator [Planctomycetota bacterium]